MKIVRLKDLGDITTGHFLKNLIPGQYLCLGGLSFPRPGFRAHTNDGPEGRDYHVHKSDYEAFVILQGKGYMELNSQKHPLVTGDVCVVEPGEDHHMTADKDDPCVLIWLHAGPERHPEQRT